MKKFLFSVALIVTSGCAPAPITPPAPPQPEWHWEKQGAASDEFNIDSGNCKAQAFSNNPESWLNIAMIMQGCMQGKGWKQFPNRQ